jgi:hypothetical protein
LTGDGDDADPSVSPGITADITIGTDVIVSGVEPLGANITLMSGGTNFAVNNLVWGGGFEPTVFRELQRVERTGIENERRWFEWDLKGSIDFWDTRSTGFLNGATIRFYRIVDESGNPIPYALGMHNAEGADRTVFLGEAKIPEPTEDLPSGGFIAEEEEGGMRRIYLDTNVGLAYGDYAFIHLKTPYVAKDVIHSRLHGWLDLGRPVFNLLWNATGRLVEHPGPIPEAFQTEDPGDSCLRIEATDGAEVTAGQYAYYKYTTTDLWYSQLRPGAPYRVEVWMRQDGLGDDGHVRFAFHGSTDYAVANQTDPWTVTGEWKKYAYDFIAPDYPEEGGIIAHTLKFTGPGTLYMDNWTIYRNDEVHGYEPFGPGENSIKTFLDSSSSVGQKPVARFYPLQYSNSSIESMLGEFGDSKYNVNSGRIIGFSGATIAQSMRWAYATGDTPDDRVVPWITVSEEYTEIELKALTEYLGVPYDPATDTPESRPYAYRRYLQRDGNGTPWTEEFREIVVEYGNETWHQGSGGYGWDGFSQPGYIHHGGREYGLFTQYMFGEQVASMPEWEEYDLGSKIKIALGANYSANPDGLTSYGEQAMQYNTVASYLGHANYVGPKWETGDVGLTSFNDHGVQETLVGSVTNSTANQLIRTAAEARSTLISEGRSPEYRLTAYEGGPSGYWSNRSKPEIDELYGKSLAMGVSALDAWLYSSYNGYGHQAFLGLGGGMWWNSHSPAEEGGLRPQPGWLALMMRNLYAKGDTMVSATVNTYPTYLRNGALVPLVSSYAMRDDEGTYSVFLLSKKLDGYHDDVTFGDGSTPVTLHLPFGSMPTRITLHKLTASDGSPADPRDNNRFEENVVITSEDIDTAYYASDFVVDEDTGGMEGGMAPGTVYLYTFSFCDGETTCVDADSDGYYAADDCDDNNSDVHSERIFYRDTDGDGYGDFSSTISVCSTTAPDGYAGASGDCDPGNASAYDSSAPYYLDADGDGYGSGDRIGRTCVAASGFSLRNDDCDDGDASRNPGISGSCDGPDDSDDDGSEDDGDDDDDDRKKRKKSVSEAVDAVRSWFSGGSGTDAASSEDGASHAFDGNRPLSSDRDSLLRMLDEAEESDEVPIPTITGIMPFPEDGIVRFQGTGAPDSDIVLFVHSGTEIVRMIRVGPDGFWRYDHRQDEEPLEPGAHEAYVVAFDGERNLKSATSETRAFSLPETDPDVPTGGGFPSAIFLVAAGFIVAVLVASGIAYVRRRKAVRTP